MSGPGASTGEPETPWEVGGAHGSCQLKRSAVPAMPEAGAGEPEALDEPAKDFVARLAAATRVCSSPHEPPEAALRSAPLAGVPAACPTLPEHKTLASEAQGLGARQPRRRSKRGAGAGGPERGPEKMAQAGAGDQRRSRSGYVRPHARPEGDAQGSEAGAGGQRARRTRGALPGATGPGVGPKDGTPRAEARPYGTRTRRRRGVPPGPVGPDAGLEGLVRGSEARAPHKPKRRSREAPSGAVVPDAGAREAGSGGKRTRRSRDAPPGANAVFGEAGELVAPGALPRAELAAVEALAVGADGEPGRQRLARAAVQETPSMAVEEAALLREVPDAAAGRTAPPGQELTGSAIRDADRLLEPPRAAAGGAAPLRELPACASASRTAPVQELSCAATSGWMYEPSGVAAGQTGSFQEPICAAASGAAPLQKPHQAAPGEPALLEEEHGGRTGWTLRGQEPPNAAAAGAVLVGKPPGAAVSGRAPLRELTSVTAEGTAPVPGRAHLGGPGRRAAQMGRKAARLETRDPREAAGKGHVPVAESGQSGGAEEVRHVIRRTAAEARRMDVRSAREAGCRERSLADVLVACNDAYVAQVLPTGHHGIPHPHISLFSHNTPPACHYKSHSKGRALLWMMPCGAAGARRPDTARHGGRGSAGGGRGRRRTRPGGARGRAAGPAAAAANPVLRPRRQRGSQGGEHWWRWQKHRPGRWRGCSGARHRGSNGGRNDGDDTGQGCAWR